MGSPLTDKQFIRLLDDRLEKKFTGGYDELPKMRDKFFTTKVDKKAWLEYYGVGDVPDPEPFEGLRSYQDVAPGYHTKIEPKEYAGGITVQRRLLDTDRYDVIEGRAERLGVAARRKMDKLAQEPFIYCDSTAFTFMIAEEGVALASNSHTTKATVSTSSGFDNLGTLPFSAANLEAVRILAKQFKSDINERIDSNFDTIIHPTQLASDVWEVQKSEGKVDSMENNANFQRGRWSAIELPRWDDVDTNNWGIADSSLMKQSLIWHQGLDVEVEFGNTTDFDTLMRKYGSYFVCGWGWIDWRWSYFCVVS